jgi:hypothetical protein
VALHRADGQKELHGDVGIGEPRRQQPQHFQLPIAERLGEG